MVLKIDLGNATLKKCITNNNGQGNFDLTRADQIIKNGISNLRLVNKFKSLDTTTNTLSNPIVNPSNYSYLPDSNTKIVYGKLTTSTGCPSFAKVTLAPTI